MSFFIGLSGLNAASEELEVTSNNIANVNTAGFKSYRDQFSSVYNQYAPGGVTLSSQTQSYSQGTIEQTGSALDMAIEGGGFFVGMKNGQQVYTRRGYFQLNAQGFITDDQGMDLQGHPVDSTGAIENGVVSNLSIDKGNLAAQQSKNVTINANLNASDTAPTVTTFDPTDANSYNSSSSVNVYDSLGKQHTLKEYYVKTGENSWNVHYTMDGKAVNSGKPETLKFDSNGNLTGYTLQSIAFNPGSGANTMTTKIDLSNMTQFASDFSIAKATTDGYASGQFTNVSVDSSGNIYANYSNGQKNLEGQVVVASIPDETELKPVGSTSWIATTSSGKPVIGTPGSGQLGALEGGAIEQSNVDLSSQLVNLITEQRNYQANAKSISAVNKMDTVLMQSM